MRPCTPATIARVATEKGLKQIAENRRARHDYVLLERIEAGLVLTGTEVKSLRDGRVVLGQAYADVRDGEAWLHGAEIAEYANGNIANHEPTRPSRSDLTSVPVRTRPASMRSSST